VHLEELAHGDSWLHRLDPRIKLMAAGGFSLVVGLAHSPAVMAAGLGLGVGLVASGRLAANVVIKRIVAINVLMAFLWVTMPWRVGWDGGPGLVFNPRGLYLAAAMTLKANAIVLALMALVSTSTVNHIFHALAHMKVPAKLVHLFLFFYRYLHVMHREYHRLNQAMAARGFRPGNNLHTYRSYAHLAGMVLVKSFDRAERVYQAMLCRGFHGTLWLLDHFHWGRAENRMAAASGVVLIVLAWAELAKWGPQWS